MIRISVTWSVKKLLKTEISSIFLSVFRAPGISNLFKVAVDMSNNGWSTLLQDHKVLNSSSTYEEMLPRERNVFSL